jgi:oxygen-independent coproporphyrinogen III oxidase
VFALITNLGADPARSLGSVEVSPGTVTGEKLRFLRGQGIDRISIGIQSFVEAETAAAGRPQKLTEVYQALEQIRAVDFPTLNLDLIYGLPGQTIASWLYSVDTALQFAPEELYLYPLYVRPLTGLGRSPKTWADDRRDFYRQARDRLLAQGYEQVSMRMFRAAQATVTPAPVYCCQSDGMVGIGCGARSYTRSLHYSSEYAVGRTGIQAILEQYQQRSDQSFSEANYGFWLTLEEQKRRFILQSILQMEGLTCARYQQTFGSEVGQDFPQLAELLALGLAHQTPTSLILTAEGIEQADTIGPWLYSAATHQLMESYAWR